MRYIQMLLSVMFLSCVLAIAPAGSAQTSFTTIDPAGATSTLAAGIHGSAGTTGGGTGTGGGPCYKGHHDSDKGEGQEPRAEDSGQGGQYSGQRVEGSGDDEHYKATCGKSDHRWTHDKHDEARDNDDKAQPQGSGTTPTSGTATSGPSVIVGYFSDVTGLSHGFQQVGTGVPTSFNIQGAASTFAAGVNAAGQTVGYYTDANNMVHGFLRSATGTVTTLDFTSNGTSALDTFALGVNDAGQVVGYYYDANFAAHGFLWTPGAATPFTSIDYHDASGTAVSATFGTGINNSGQIVGYYDDMSLGVHGFLSAGGTFTTHDVQDPVRGVVYTFVTGINTSGQMVGTYWDASFNVHGFKMAGGSTTLIDLAGAMQTDVNGIDDTGRVVGEYVDTALKQHGFSMP